MLVDFFESESSYEKPRVETIRILLVVGYNNDTVEWILNTTVVIILMIIMLTIVIIKINNNDNNTNYYYYTFITLSAVDFRGYTK